MIRAAGDAETDRVSGVGGGRGGGAIFGSNFGGGGHFGGGGNFGGGDHFRGAGSGDESGGAAGDAAMGVIRSLKILAAEAKSR